MKSKHVKKLWALVAAAVAAVGLFATGGHPSAGNGAQVPATEGCPIHGVDACNGD